MVPPGLFWRRMTDEERGALRRSGIERTFPRGAVLLSQGEYSKHLVVVLEGTVKAVAHNPDGKQTLLGLRTAGDIVGELSGLVGGWRMATVTATSPVCALLIRAEQFAIVARDHPGISRALLETMAARVWETDQWRIDASRSLESRLAGTLLELSADFGATADDGGIELSAFTQEDFAGLLCVSRESVVRALAELRRSGAIRTGRHRIVVVDCDALRGAATAH